MINKEAPVSYTKKRIFACIDLGSSYFRLLVAECPGSGGISDLTPLLEERIFTGWGNCLQGDGVIDRETSESAMRVLRRLVKLSAEAGCDRPVIVATNTLRKAVNAEQTATMFEQGISLPVEVLSQDEEAALSFAGASSVLSEGCPAIVIDMGGTSTEIAWGVDGVISGATGIQLGTLSVRARMSRSNLRDVRSRRGRDASRNCSRFIREQLCRARGSIDRTGGGLSFLPPGGEKPKIIFTGGTAVSTGMLARYMDGSRPFLCESAGMSTRVFELVRRRTCFAFESGRERFFPLDAGRLDLLLPGLALMNGVLDLMSVITFRVVTRDLRWAVIMRENGRIDTR